MRVPLRKQFALPWLTSLTSRLSVAGAEFGTLLHWSSGRCGDTDVPGNSGNSGYSNERCKCDASVVF